MANPISNLWRLMRAGYVLARHDALLDPEQMEQAPLPLRVITKWMGGGKGEQTATALSSLGPSYIKLGQFLSTRPDMIGAKRAFNLKSLQDRLPPFSQAEAEATIARELGRPVSELFQSFGPPVAAASIAQVHKAVTKSGDEVAVKILRPGIEKRFANDIESFAFAARIMEVLSAEGRRLRPVAAVEMLRSSMVHELDLRMEAAALSEIAENTKDDPDFRVPKIHWGLSAKRVMTTEWINGTPMSDVVALKARGLDLHAMANTVIQSFLRHAIRDGFFHADMHQGNLMVDETGKLVAFDFGITGRLSQKDPMFLAQILYGFITKDYTLVSQVHFDAGYVPYTEDVATFAQAIRSIGEPIMGLPADQISMARLLTQLFEVTEQFHMQTQPQLLLLQKTMVVTEGVARTLNPDLNIWKAGEPVVRHWIERKLGPLGKVEELGASAKSLGRLALMVPDLMKEAEDFTRRLKEMMAAPPPRQSRAMTVALWGAAVALIVIAVKLVL
jgi:ubiquinone biosynthesis protein